MYVEYLSKINSHERDQNILFDEEPHIYTVKGNSNYTSVTTWNHSHFPKFDSNKIIDNMMKSSKWPQNKYYGKTKQQILDIWEENKNNAATAGTKLHYDIECYYNNQPNINDSIEYKYFENFIKDYEHLKPYRTEWMVYSEELLLAGSIDMVFEKENGNLMIYDWKRCKDIKKFNSFNVCAINPIICDIPDTNYWHYCLQLNTYKAILEKYYDKIVDDLYLVCLHPENINNNYLRIKVVNLQNQINELFEERIKLINNL